MEVEVRMEVVALAAVDSMVADVKGDSREVEDRMAEMEGVDLAMEVIEEEENMAVDYAAVENTAMEVDEEDLMEA